jgi:hypothetical protein
LVLGGEAAGELGLSVGFHGGGEIVARLDPLVHKLLEFEASVGAAAGITLPFDFGQVLIRLGVEIEALGEISFFLRTAYRITDN